MRAPLKPKKSPAEPKVYGAQRPRVLTLPPTGRSTAGQEAIDLAARAGLHLDPWQQYVLNEGMRETDDGDWAAFEVCVNVPRQNGKGGIIEARELWGLFISDEKLILHTAHQFKTSKAAFRRIVALIRNCPDLHKRVAAYRFTVGEESIELHDGSVLQFLARSKGSGRGFTGDLNVMDEDMYLGDPEMDALMFTMAAVPNPQIWYFGSAGVGAPSVQLGRLRRRALAAVEMGVPDPELAYFEWSISEHADECTIACTEHDDVDDEASILKANPAIGYRLTLEKTARERSVSKAGFARERLGVGDYPSDEADSWQVIGEAAWRDLAHKESHASDAFAISIDMTPERSHVAIGIAGEWEEGARTHVEVIAHQPGTAWVIEWAKKRQEKWDEKDWKPRCWVIDGGGPAGTLIAPLEEALGITVVQPKVREIAQGCGEFYDAVGGGALSHVDQAPLAVALAGAQKRQLGDAWAWSRRSPDADISPLVAVTFAKWGLTCEVEEVDDVNPMDNIW